MKYLADTHIILWSLTDDKRLGTKIRDILLDSTNEIYFSMASAWEITIKAKVGKLPLQTSLETVFENVQFDSLPIKLDHVLASYELPLHHGDPFDRMLIAQAKIEGLTLITADEQMKKYDVPLLKV